MELCHVTRGVWLALLLSTLFARFGHSETSGFDPLAESVIDSIIREHECGIGTYPGHAKDPAWLEKCEEPFKCSDGSPLDWSKVDDGVCDCNDGSDEPTLDCQAPASTGIPRTKRTSSWQPSNPKLRIKLRRSIREGSAILSNVEKGFKHGIEQFKELQAAVSTPQDRQQLQQLAQQLRVYDSILQSPKGPHQVLSALLGQCVDSPLVDDKHLRGGSVTVVPKAYIFTVCPFVNVTQREFAPDEWKSAEESAHGADLEPFPKRSLAEAEVKPRGTAAVSSGATGAAEVLGLHGEKYEWTKGPMWGNPILLGHWSGIRRCSNDDEWLRAGQTQADILRGDAQWEFLKQESRIPVDQFVMVFEGGSPCGDVPYRTVQVRLVCGPGFPGRIIDVEEDGVCSYLMTLQSPVACESISEFMGI